MRTALDVLALRSVPGVGDVGVVRGIADHGSAAAAMDRRSHAERSAAYTAAQSALLAAQQRGIGVTTIADPGYPARLRDVSDPPAVLFHRGLWEMADSPAVAIVGTRTASSYGLRVARAIATTCARAGVSVISGLAAGIDGAAHEGALAAEGRTVAVLGTGVDVAYPRRHRALQEAVAQRGLLLSETPPGSSGHSGAFPRRNRIIAALADLTIVVEAGERSGALITAEVAHALDRRLACVPNAIDVPSSRGSNALLKAFAEPILHPDDVLALLDMQAQPIAAPILDATAAACWDAVQAGAIDVASIVTSSGLSHRAVTAAIAALEVEGLLAVDFSGQVRPAADVAHLAGAGRP